MAGVFAYLHRPTLKPYDPPADSQAKTRRGSLSTPKELVCQSWDDMQSHVYLGLFSIFYAELFNAYPEAKLIFSEKGLKRRSQCFSSLLSYVVHESLHGHDHELRKLGRQHGALGVSPALLAAVGRALLSALQQILRDEWTLKVHNAWLTVLGDTLGHMTGLSMETMVERLLACHGAGAPSLGSIVREKDGVVSPCRRMSGEGQSMTWKTFDDVALTPEVVFANRTLHKALVSKVRK